MTKRPTMAEWLAEPGRFVARVARYGGDPDSEGDIIEAGAVADATQAVVSVLGHSSMTDDEPPGGDASLWNIGDSVWAFGAYRDTPEGRRLREVIERGADAVEWSIGYRVLRARAPTAAERQRWPDVKRILLALDVFEVSPVRRSACGPSCRTLAAKASGACCEACAPAAVREPALRELARAEVLRAKWLTLQMEESEREFEARWAAIAAQRPESYEIPEEDVDPARRGAALFGLKLARQALDRLDEVEHLEPVVRWFERDAPPKALGFGSRGGDLWLRDGLDLATTVEVAAHEYGHYVFGTSERAAERLGQLARLAYEQRGLDAKLLPGDTWTWDAWPTVSAGAIVVEPGTLQAWQNRGGRQWDEIP